MAKLDTKQTVYSLTLFIAIAYIICIGFFWILPEQSATFSKNLFHGVAIENRVITLANFIIGLIEAVILSAIGSLLFVWIYNKFSAKGKY